MTQDQERAEFEAWAQHTNDITHSDADPSLYRDHFTQVFWDAWQASNARRTPASPAPDVQPVERAESGEQEAVPVALIGGAALATCPQERAEASVPAAEKYLHISRLEENK